MCDAYVGTCTCSSFSTAYVCVIAPNAATSNVLAIKVLYQLHPCLCLSISFGVQSEARRLTRSSYQPVATLLLCAWSRSLVSTLIHLLSFAHVIYCYMHTSWIYLFLFYCAHNEYTFCTQNAIAKNRICIASVGRMKQTSNTSKCLLAFLPRPCKMCWM